MTALERIDIKCKEAIKELDEFYKPQKRTTLYGSSIWTRRKPLKKKNKAGKSNG